ncbi:MAG TPA: NADH-quinone oxidoreductase subunit C [Terriglobales bacterium]|nr:NADH-quinone oxidoreductase subunit C [Terriglobales bacterium]
MTGTDMPEETKGTDQSTPKPNEQKLAAEETKTVEVSASAKPAELPKPAADAAKTAAPTAAKPAAPAAPKPAAPGAPAAKPAAPAKPAGPAPTPWASELVARFKARYGSGIKEASTYMGQNYLVVDESIVMEVLRYLCDDEQFDYCVDITAVHYPKREKQFDMVYVLYSFTRNERVRVKTQIADGKAQPTASGIWPTANWLEREAFDMFGIKFEGHPDLRRILLPDGWTGYPLRKDYDILKQDTGWVKANLGIESGQ